MVRMLEPLLRADSGETRKRRLWLWKSGRLDLCIAALGGRYPACCQTFAQCSRQPRQPAPRLHEHATDITPLAALPRQRAAAALAPARQQNSHGAGLVGAAEPAAIADGAGGRLCWCVGAQEDHPVLHTRCSVGAGSLMLRVNEGPSDRPIWRIEAPGRGVKVKAWKYTVLPVPLLALAAARRVASPPTGAAGARKVDQPIRALETGAKGERKMMQQHRANSHLFGGNAPYVEELYESYLDNPGSVSEN